VHDDTSPKEARQQLSSYFELYNHKRLHQALDDQTPAEVYSAGTPSGSF
jgi:transposase InsO family protein